MARGVATLVLAGAIVVVTDLTHKAVAVADRGSTVAAHPRSALYVVGLTVVAALWAAAVLLTRSPSIAEAAGVVCGGAAANVLSLALWPSVPGIPNPLLAGGVAFNVADLAVVTGTLGLLATTGAFAARNRELLREPVRLRG